MLVKRLTPTAQLPTKAYHGDAGWDLYVDDSKPLTLSPGKRVLISTGCSFKIPEGYYGRIADRSSVAWKSGCHVLAGVVDCGYRNEVKVVLINLSEEEFTINPGDKIAQIIITPIFTETLTEVDNLDSLNSLDQTERGNGGFGSSNR